MRKFLLVNQAFFNRGDESAHKALVYNLLRKFPDCRIEVLFVGRDQEAIADFNVGDNRVTYTNLSVRNFYRNNYIRILRSGFYPLLWLSPAVRKIARRMHSVDWVICSPGGASLGIRYDWDHLFFVQLAEFCRCRLAYMGRSIGPFVNDSPGHMRFNYLAAKVLRKADFVSLRDAESEKIADALGVRYHSSLDLSFLTTTIAQVPPSVTDMIGAGKYAVVVPDYMLSHPDFRHASPVTIKTFYVEMIRRMLAEFPDVEIVLLPQLFNGRDYLSRDVDFFTDIASAVASDRVVVIPETYSSDLQQSLISGAEFVVSARYHPVVFAVNSGIPFVALRYEHQMKGLLDSLGKQDRGVDISTAFDRTGKPRLAERAVGSLPDNVPPLDMRVAIAQTMDRLRTLKCDPDAQALAKKKTSECFDKWCEMVENNK